MDSEIINPMSLKNKRIIVTGAASGIGRETAYLIHKLGGYVVLLDLNEDALIQIQNELGKERCFIAPCDLLDIEKIKEIVTGIKNEVGKLNGFVHCAGIPSVVPLRALSNDAYEKVQKINTEAALSLAKVFSSRAIYDQEQVNSIVLISSVYGVVGSACNAAYATSKGAIIGLTKALAIELAPKRIRVNCVAPGFIKTNMADGVNKMFDENYAERIENMHPLGWGEAIDIANAIAFLLSDASKWTTGAVFNIDGGYTAQ